MGRRLAVSDIHGERDRLQRVLDMAKYEPANDRLFLLGDYIDRGPDAKGTVDLVRQLQRNGAIALKGNHDAVLVAYYHGDATRYAWLRKHGFERWLEQGGTETLASYGGDVPDDVLAWLDALPLYHEEPDCILVHAGLKPGIPLEQQAHDDLLWIRDEFYGATPAQGLSACDHRRYTGKKVIFGHTPTRILHESYPTPAQGLHTCDGHTPTSILHQRWEPWYGVDKVGIDTGAVWGGVLTLYDLDTQETWTA